MHTDLLKSAAEAIRQVVAESAEKADEEELCELARRTGKALREGFRELLRPPSPKNDVLG